jgi:predicted Fe-Mo cluster-binding NifX family protein
MKRDDPTPTRAAFATWQDRIAPVFDVAGHLLIVDAAAGRIAAREQATLAETAPAGRARRLAELGVEVLICGAVSQPLAAQLAGHGIRIIPFVTGPLDEVVAGWLHGQLGAERFAMPGCCGRPRGGGRRCTAGDGTGGAMTMNGRGGGMGGGRGMGGGGRGGGGGAGGGGGGGMGRLGGPQAGGPGGVCACPGCGHEQPHQPGFPCSGQRCPNCGQPLVRK